MPRVSWKKQSKPWNPPTYQKNGVKFLIERTGAALFLTPGLGKTSITLAAITFLMKRGHAKKTLVLAPLRVCHSVWPKEAKKWQDFSHLRVVVLHGPKKEELLRQDADIYVMNYEGLDWLLGVTKTKSAAGRTKVTVNMKRWKSLGFDTLVCDELTRLKHIGTNRFKAIKQVLHTFKRRWGLTGSPSANGLEHLFGQCYILDEGKALGRYITHYRNKYFIPSYDGFGWYLATGSEEKIFRKIKHLAMRVGDEVLDMPELVTTDIRIDLPPKAMRVYHELEKDLWASIEGGTVTAANAAVASSKCRQVANGGVYVDPEVEALVKLPSSKREWVDLHELKVDAIEELVNDLQGAPLLVAYEFQHDLERLKKRFGKDLPYIGGGITSKRSNQLEEAWNKGHLPFLFGHPKSIGHGLNLQEVGNHVAWHSMTWDYELYDQFLRRVYRQGNTNSRTYLYRIIATGTVDESMVRAINSKEKGQNKLFKSLREQSLERKSSPVANPGEF